MVIAELLYTNGAGEVFVLDEGHTPRYEYSEDTRSWVLHVRGGIVVVPRDHVVRMSVRRDVSDGSVSGGDMSGK